MSKKFIAFYEGLVLSGIDLGIQTTSLVLNNWVFVNLEDMFYFSQQKLPQA